MSKITFVGRLDNQISIYPEESIDNQQARIHLDIRGIDLNLFNVENRIKTLFGAYRRVRVTVEYLDADA